MKGLKTTLIAVIAVGLLAGSAVGVAAQDEAAVFVWDTTPGEAVGTGTIEAGDPRASGALTIGLGEALVTDALLLGTFSLRLVNDDGEWTGTGRAFGGDEEQNVDIWELNGAGGYDGLSLFMFDYEGATEPWGVIAPSDAIPPYPELPAE